MAELHDPRYQIASPRAGEFGLDCCTWIETIFQELLRDPRWDNLEGIDDARKSSSVSMETYRRVFGAKLGFDRAGYPLKWLDTPVVRPFETWASDENPEWFKVYSKYKHDRFELANRFTLGHALMAFTALAILVNHWPGYDPGLRSPTKRPPSRVLKRI